MKRFTCIECQKKRYQKKMVKTSFLNTSAFYDIKVNHWICIECIDTHTIRLENQIWNLKKEIIKLNKKNNVNFS